MTPASSGAARLSGRVDIHFHLHGVDDRPRELADAIVRRRLAAVVASDAHSLELGPALAPVRPLVERVAGRAYARLAVDAGPRALVETGAVGQGDRVGAQAAAAQSSS